MWTDVKSLLLSAALISLGSACLAADLQFLLSEGDYRCPTDHRLLSIAQAEQNKSAICNAIADWSSARLAGQGSISGSAYNCTIRQDDPRSLQQSICTPFESFSNIRGVLLRGRFRTQSELMAMSGQDWRAALVTELANRTAETSDSYNRLSNEDLAGAGELLVYHLQYSQTRAAQIAPMTIKDMRKALIKELNRQTGIPVQKLSGLTNRELIALLDAG